MVRYWIESAAPYPGTELFEQARLNGWFAKKDKTAIIHQDGFQDSSLEYPGLSKETVTGAVDRGLKRFYFRPSYMIKFLLQTRSWGDLYRKLRGLKNFLSYLVSERLKK